MSWRAANRRKSRSRRSEIEAEIEDPPPCSLLSVRLLCARRSSLVRSAAGAEDFLDLPYNLWDCRTGGRRFLVRISSELKVLKVASLSRLLTVSCLLLVSSSDRREVRKSACVVSHSHMKWIFTYKLNVQPTNFRPFSWVAVVRSVGLRMSLSYSELRPLTKVLE